MAELLVRVVDKVGPDVYADAKLTKRGDVIVVCMDGWAWGTEELGNPAFRILRIPGVEPDALSWLLVGEPESNPQQPSKTLQRRAFKLDLDSAAVTKADLRDFFDQHTVAPPTAKDGEQLADLKVVEVIPSTIEQVTPVVDGAGTIVDVVVSADVVTRTKETYVVATLSVETVKKLAPLVGVSVCGPVLRDQLQAEVTPELIDAIAVRKPPINDPRVIGLSPTVIG